MSTAPEQLPAVHAAYEIGGFRVGLESIPFHESEALAAFREEGCREPDLRMEIRAVPEIRAPRGIEAAEVGETVYFDDLGRKVRLCKNERKTALLYRVTKLDKDSSLAEFTPPAGDGPGSYLILRWLDLPGAFLERGAVFLHASFLRYRGRAILFTGEKQIGKSTQAELWRRHRDAEVLNGDRALLRRIDGVWTACGSPFSGTSGICVNGKAPVAAIVLLGQGPENRVEPVDLKTAYGAFLSGCTYDPGDRQALERVLSITEALHREVPMLRLICTPDERAVFCLEQAMRGVGIHV